MQLFRAYGPVTAKKRVPGGPVDAPPPRAVPEPAQAAHAARIRCPLCQWQPKRSSRWMCSTAGAPEYFANGCGHVWNTFDTRGRCPGCSYQWRHTACLSCAGWSLHDDWYEKEQPK